MRSRLLPWCCAGAYLAAIDAGVVLSRSFDLFLSQGERGLYLAATALSLLWAVVVAGWLIAVALEPPAHIARRAWALAAGGAGGLLGVLLTEGRRVRDVAYRPLLALAVAAVVTLFVWGLLQGGRTLVWNAVPGRRRLAAWAALAAAGGAVALDVLVLPRGYPAFHAGISLAAVLLAAWAASVWPAKTPGWLAGARWSPLRSLGLVALSGAVAGFLALRLAHHPNAGFLVREHGAFSRKLVALVPVAQRRPVPAPPSVAVVVAGAAKVDLRDRDVLIVTVDALRADQLAAYGGRGLTPHMDALAAEGVVFKHAYTPAPHTSYALASMLTAKFVKPVAELDTRPRDHVTLPDLLRRYGYRTAAFYPPAIFFVDGARFAPLHQRAFGFEYRKEMYASAAERVQQLDMYLRSAAPGHPLLLWVHLFEPHEPYDPPPEWTARGTARSRYEGEVAEADRAFGELVRVFRSHKPQGTVILTADHGEEFGDHGGAFHGSTLYDEQVRVPFVWSSPGAITHHVSEVPVELVDIGSTVLATAHVPRDPRMHGDDLSAALTGDDAHGPRFAFASVEDRSMVMDGTLKVVCAASETHCQLFDTARDPAERRSENVTRPDQVARLRGVLDSFLRSIPATEALAVSAGVAFPEALARAELGVAEAMPEVARLLADLRPEVRAKAARLLGERGVTTSAERLAQLRRTDADPDVRAEAAISALALGQDAALDDVRAQVVDGAAPGERARRAALVLARYAELAAAPVLAELVSDADASESMRLAGIDALAELPTPVAANALMALLDEPRLGARATDALRRGGFRQSIDAVVEALRDQRYPALRTAQARLLFAFGDGRVAALVTRFLGMETSMPSGLSLLEEFGVLAGLGREGGLIARSSLRRGRWECDNLACAPRGDARLALARPAAGKGPYRLVLAVTDGPAGAVLHVAGQVLVLRGGAEEVNVLVDASALRAGLPMVADDGVLLHAALLVPAEPEIPPPAPEPWRPGTDEAVNSRPAPDH
jgi:arylsulfatase A-like enzyme/HEAT repeat protein